MNRDRAIAATALGFAAALIFAGLILAAGQYPIDCRSRPDTYETQQLRDRGGCR